MSLPAGGALLLDLDGTLADTAPDMGGALNALLVEEQRPPIPLSRIRPWVSHGAWALVRLGFGEALSEDRRMYLRERLLTHYAAGICRETTLFAGLDALLERLEALQHRWGIVTNKPGWLTAPLVAALGLNQRAGVVVSGDTLEKAKPHPEPLWHAASRLDTRPQHCIYVGDAARDIEAGRAAGMRTIAAGWGYIPRGEDPRGWNADHVANQPEDLPALLFAGA